MTFLEMQTYFRMLVDDRNSDSWDDTEVKNFLNRAQEEIQGEINEADERYFEACQTYSVEPNADAHEFTLPADHMKVTQAERFVSGSAPIPATWVPFAQRHMPGTFDDRPRLYLRGTKLGVVAPAESYTLVVWYTKRLADLVADADVSEVPIEHHQFLVLKAAQACMLSDGQDFTRWEKKYSEKQAALALFLENRQRQEPRRVHYIPE